VKTIGTISVHPENTEYLFAKLYTKYNKQVRDYIFHQTSDLNLAEDLCQDVFLKLWTKRESFSKIDDITAYLFRSARNEFIDHSRKEKIKHRVQQVCKEKQPGIVNATEEIIREREMEVVLQQSIQRLSPKRKKIYVLIKIEGLPYSEVAGLLGLALPTVKEMMRLSNQQVRKYINKYLGTDKIKKYNSNKLIKGELVQVKTFKAA
jgi:RNA polymerase sigma-70 factor (ECF subfamily)